MEFVIMLPFYLLLMGAAVMLGDVALRAIWATHGDGLVILSKGAESKLATGYLMLKQFPTTDLYEYEVGGVAQSQDVVTWQGATYRAKPDFKGAWGWQVAGTATDAYALPPWARGWLAYSENTYWEQSGERFGPNFALVLRDIVGRLLVRSKDLNGSGGTRKYACYTLMRTPKAHDANQPYRRWKQADLSKCSLLPVTGTEWYNNVYGEPQMDADATKLDANDGQGDDSYPSKPSGRDEFPRAIGVAPLSQ